MAAKKKKKVEEEVPVLVVTSKVKAYVSEELGYRMSGDAPQALSDEVRRLLDKAAERAEAAGRSTIKATDI
jgi:histone H3/H4